MSGTDCVFTQRDIKRLLFKISRISSDEHKVIFDIIKKYDVGYTQNNNGVFLSLSSVPNMVIKEIDEYVDSSLQNMSDRDNNITRSEETHNKEEGGDEVRNEKQGKNKRDIEDKMTQDNKDNESGIGEVENGQEWLDVLNKVENNAKVIQLVNCLEESYDNLHKKKGNIKYANAMKKYGRMYTNDKKFDPDVKNTLTSEPYSIDEI